MIKYLERSGEEGVPALRHRLAPFVRGVFAGDLYGEMGEPAVRRPDLLRHADAAWVSVSAISVFVTPLFFADIRWYRNGESVSPCAMSAVTVTMLRSRSEIYNLYNKQ